MNYKYLKLLCNNDLIDYNSIKRRIIYMDSNQRYKDYSFKQKYELAKSKYDKKHNIDIIKLKFKLLEKITTYKDYKYICYSLKINFKTVIRLTKITEDFKYAILVIWYFGNKETKNGKSISNEKFLKVINGEIFNDKIYQFINYYKCGKKQYLEDIINYEYKYLKSICFKVLKKFNIIPVREKIEDLISHSNLVLINTIDNIVLNDIKYIVKYIHTVLYYRIFDYVKSNYKIYEVYDENKRGSMLDEDELLYI